MGLSCVCGCFGSLFLKTEWSMGSLPFLPGELLRLRLELLN